MLGRADVEFDPRAGRNQDVEAHLEGPLEEHPQVVAVGVERAALIAGQETPRPPGGPPLAGRRDRQSKQHGR